MRRPQDWAEQAEQHSGNVHGRWFIQFLLRFLLIFCPMVLGAYMGLREKSVAVQGSSGAARTWGCACWGFSFVVQRSPSEAK